MSDIVDRLQEARMFYAHRPSVQDRLPLCAEISAGECARLTVVLGDAQIEIERLRSLLKEAGEALFLIVGPDACKSSYEEECVNYEVARNVLSKIKGEA